MFSQNVEIVQTIKEKLSQIERRENIRILYACESGSRAWGFASADSDYDVRFVYVRPLEDYLRIKDLPDFIDGELDEVYDINGWDLKKFCKQVLKSNPVMFEWIQSPIVYKTSPEWESNKSLFLEFYDKVSGFHHYSGMAKKNCLNLICEDEKTKLPKKNNCKELAAAFENSKNDVSYKKYLYVLRPLLACEWINKKNFVVPIEFEKLVQNVLPKELIPLVNELLEQKKNSLEKQKGNRIFELDKFIQEKIESLFYESSVQSFREHKSSEILDCIFYKCIMN